MSHTTCITLLLGGLFLQPLISSQTCAALSGFSASSPWPIQSILDPAPGFLMAPCEESQEPAQGSHT